MTSQRLEPQPGGREVVAAALFFAALTVLMTWPQAVHLGDRVGDLWDAKQNAWILDWDFRQTFRDPANLFQAPIFHPARYALAFSENLYGGALFGFPLRAAGVSILANYNAVFLFSMAFSGWAAWLLARYVTGDGLASLLAGLIYAFVPWRFSQLPHINMQFGGFLCLLFLFLLRYLDGGRRRDLVLFAACFAGNLLSTFHYGLFSGFLLAVVLVVEASASREARRRVPGVILAAGAATLLCAPFLIPYTKAAKLYGMRRSLEEMREFSARPSDFLAAGNSNRLYGRMTQRWERIEGDLFPGVLPLVLAAGAAVALRRSPSARRCVLLVGVGLAGVVVAAGANLPVYRLLFERVGSVFRAIRVPSRAIILSHAALGVLAAWGLSLATRRLGRGARIAVVVAAFALVTVEYRAFPLELYPYDSGPLAAYEWTRSLGAEEVVVELPLGFPYDCEAMLRQAEHGKPIVNGHQSYFPPAYQRLTADMRGRPIPATVWDQIESLGATLAIFHHQDEPSYDRVRYRRLLREGLAAGRVTPVREFLEPGGRTYALRLGGARTASAPASDPEARRSLERLLASSDADAAPPTGLLHAPAEGQAVAPGFWAFGWAVDDSGIAAIEVVTESGVSAPVALRQKFPGVDRTFPTLPGTDLAGYGFMVPPLPPGPHTFKITFVGNDGGRTEISKRIVITAPAPKP